MELQELKTQLRNNTIAFDILSVGAEGAVLRVGPDTHPALVTWLAAREDSLAKVLVIWPEALFHPQTLSALKRIVPTESWQYQIDPELADATVRKCFSSGLFFRRPAMV